MLGVLTLLLMAAYFLSISWRKWTDPLIDGHQWYTAWRLSNGDVLYRDVGLAYGPLSAYFNATLFSIFGPGMMILVTANLVIYSLILALSYFTFRIAWGRLGAFAASSVFISVFSFSQLIPVGNFNFAAPYSHEIIHGVLLILITTIIAERWCRNSSLTLAFLFGLCGGVATVLKPEFMLAGGVLGIGSLVLRFFSGQRVRVAEIALILVGLALPTISFTIWFAQTEPWKSAFVHTSQAWWLVLMDSTQRGAAFQQNAVGINHLWKNCLFEIGATASACAMIGSIWFVGWAFSRPWSIIKRIGSIVMSGCLVYATQLDGGWLNVGLCLPGLVGVLLVVVVLRLRSELRKQTNANRSTIMAFMLVLLGGAMLARMLFRARISDFGFYQAAFAGMVVAAAIVTELPRWTGSGIRGHRIALCGCAAMLVFGCFTVAAVSYRIRSTQTQPVGSGLDRFYAFDEKINATGELTDWVIKRLKSIPANATLLVLPEGALINYSSRHRYPVADWIAIGGGTTEDQELQIINRLRQVAPDFIVLISRSMIEHGITHFGARGTPGNITLNWITGNYVAIASRGDDPFAPKGKKGAIILQRKP